MGNAYADLATLKSPGLLNIPEGMPDGAQDGRLLGLLETASRWIDGYCGRSFAAVSGERRFDGDGGDALLTPDLVSVSRLRTRPPGRTAGGDDGDGWTEWAAGEYLLYPLNGAPDTAGGQPYTRVLTAAASASASAAAASSVSGGRRRFPAGRATVSIAGVWGYGGVREDTGLRLAAGASLGSGDGAATAAPASASPAAGHTIRIDDEDLYVTAAIRDAAAGSTTLSIRRGVNGTAAAAHDAGAVLGVYRYPAAVTEACLLQAAAWWRQRMNAPFAALPSGRRRAGAVVGSGDVADDGIEPAARALLEPLRRRASFLGV